MTVNERQISKTQVFANNGYGDIHHKALKGWAPLPEEQTVEGICSHVKT